MDHRFVLGMRVDAVTYEAVAAQVIGWARAARPGYVCVANVHMVMEAFDDPSFRKTVNDAAIVTPDGVPLVWALRRLGVTNATRVYGPTLTQVLCTAAEAESVPVAFIGGTQDTLDALNDVIQMRWPSLRVVYTWSPPFRALTPHEEDRMIRDVNSSGARMVFIGLGCPKQERWMGRLHARINAPLIGVGAAFDFISGRKAQAPGMLQRVGLEWLFRLVSEPARLWRRYVYHNPRFIVYFAQQLIREGR
jgi:N-acetylglucosaminyldiphosphoundecaprenol N-acetyl-beta-D-mannosaminyltransferase